MFRVKKSRASTSCSNAGAERTRGLSCGTIVHRAFAQTATSPSLVRLTLREILEKVFGLIPRFKSKDELLEEEFAKFVADTKPEDAEAIPAIKTFFKAYVTSDQVRHIIESRQFTDLATNAVFSTRDFRAVPEKYRTLIPEYIKDYVSLNQFAA